MGLFDSFLGGPGAASIEINTPTGKLQFSTDTPIEDVRSTIGEHANTLNDRISALTEWGQQFVNFQHRNGNVSALEEFPQQVRSLVDSWLDEADAAAPASEET